MCRWAALSSHICHCTTVELVGHFIRLFHVVKLKPQIHNAHFSVNSLIWLTTVLPEETSRRYLISYSWKRVISFESLQSIHWKPKLHYGLKHSSLVLVSEDAKIVFSIVYFSCLIRLIDWNHRLAHLVCGQYWLALTWQDIRHSTLKQHRLQWIQKIQYCPFGA